MSRLKANQWRAECKGNLHAPFWEGRLEKYYPRIATRWVPTLLLARREGGKRRVDQVMLKPLLPIPIGGGLYITK